MYISSMELERYKGYSARVRLELRPLTLLVGRNNSGKTALTRALPLFAGGLAPEPDTTEPLPLRSYGVTHGDEFVDLVTRRTMHGRVSLGAELVASDGHLVALEAEVLNVVAVGEASSRHVLRWQARVDHNWSVALDWLGLERDANAATYRVAAARGEAEPSQTQCEVAWKGLLPIPGDWLEDEEVLASFHAISAELEAWTRGLRYLRSPRATDVSSFRVPEGDVGGLQADGRNAPLLLAQSAELEGRVRAWYGSAFEASLHVRQAGALRHLEVRDERSGHTIPLAHAGQGLTQVLPVAVLLMTRAAAGPGVDIIEHPEAELHPGAHAAVAELCLANIVGRERPLVLETHSELLLLRARRWVAEGRIAPEDVAIYWIDTGPDGAATVQFIEVTTTGEVETWPEGVFYEDYEEILAIRRAARSQANG